MRMQARRERIDELEKWAAAKEAAWNETVKQIWTRLPLAEVEALMTAHAAERAGRPVNGARIGGPASLCHALTTRIRKVATSVGLAA